MSTACGLSIWGRMKLRQYKSDPNHMQLSACTFTAIAQRVFQFFYEEIFVRASYFRHGVSVPRKGAPVIVDVGANIGLFSLSCLRQNPRARILAVEPIPAVFNVLERNLSAHDTTRCMQLAVRDRPGDVKLYVRESATGESTCNRREWAMQRARLQEASRELPGMEGAQWDAGPPFGGSEGSATSVTCQAVSLSQLLKKVRVLRPGEMPDQDS